MRHEYYKLVIDTEKGQPVAVPSDTYDRCEELRFIGQWRSWVGALRVSTVFLSINHSCDDDELPMIFETFVFPALGWGEIWAAFAWRYQLRSALTLANVYAKALWRTVVVTVRKSERGK